MTIVNDYNTQLIFRQRQADLQAEAVRSGLLRRVAGRAHGARRQRLTRGAAYLAARVAS